MTSTASPRRRARTGHRKRRSQSTARAHTTAPSAPAGAAVLPAASERTVAPRRTLAPERPAPERTVAPRRTVAPERPAAELLASYRSATACLREVLALEGAGGSLLVVDRHARSGRDARLVAHLARDEPRENAALLARMYIAAGPVYRARCRPLSAEDLRTVPFAGAPFAESPAYPPGALEGASGELAILEPLDARMSIPELRWCLQRRNSASPRRCSLRDVVGALESYEPACSATEHALALHADHDAVSTAVLASELRRVRNSPIVLNRALRERVLAEIAREQLSMSEIAIRCRRVKRDPRGNESGETSWLARRLGLLPDTGRRVPTPWVHSDVLALIARDGLGVSPREVELH